MSLKTKLAVGIMSGALGLSLVGGGTWAAFNDVETVTNTFAAGTLDLGAGNATDIFNVDNLKPGDYFTKSLTLTNDGSLDINDILLKASVVEGSWTNKDILKLNDKVAGAGNNSVDDFLGQFKVKITKKVTGTADSVVYDKTLKELKADTTGDKTIEITGTKARIPGINEVAGLPKIPATTITYDFYVEFVESDTLITGTRLHAQNKYQGESATLKFDFEATQMPGEQR